MIKMTDLFLSCSDLNAFVRPLRRSVTRIKYQLNQVTGTIRRMNEDETCHNYGCDEYW
jgi:hypothetical protein